MNFKLFRSLSLSLLLTQALFPAFANAPRSASPEIIRGHSKVACASEEACAKYLRAHPRLLSAWQKLQPRDKDFNSVDGGMRVMFSRTKTKCLPLFLGRPRPVQALEVSLILKYPTEFPKGLDYELFYIGRRPAGEGALGALEGSVGLIESNDYDGFEVDSASPTAIFPRSTVSLEQQLSSLKEAVTRCSASLSKLKDVQIAGDLYKILASEIVSSPDAHSPEFHVIVQGVRGLQSLNVRISSDGTLVYFANPDFTHLFDIK